MSDRMRTIAAQVQQHLDQADASLSEEQRQQLAIERARQLLGDQALTDEDLAFISGGFGGNGGGGGIGPESEAISESTIEVIEAAGSGGETGA